MKKGFTLIELVAVVVVLGVMALITFPIVNNSIKEGKERSYNNQVSNIVDAAKKWSVKNVSLLPTEDGASINVSINDLITSGLLSNPKEGYITNPIDNTRMNGCVKIQYTATYDQYEYEYITTCN